MIVYQAHRKPGCYSTHKYKGEHIPAARKSASLILIVSQSKASDNKSSCCPDSRKLWDKRSPPPSWMPLITADAHCPTFPQMGSLPGSLALHQWLKELCSWNSSRRPLDVLGATSGTEEDIVIVLSGSTCGTWPRKPTGHKHKWQLLLLSCLSAFARQGDHNASHKGKWVPGVECWAELTRVRVTHKFPEVECSQVPSGQRFGWALDEKHVRGIIFPVQSRKGQADHSACAWIFLTVSSFLFSCRFFISSCFPSPWQGSSEQGFSTSCNYTFTSSLPGNFPSISTAVLPSKWAQIIFPVNI